MKLEIRDFTYSEFENLKNKLEITSSPSRQFSDLFWLNLPWTSIKEELGGLNILDIGCGSGVYGVKLIDYSNNNISSYTGVDILKNTKWKKIKNTYPFFKFYIFDSNNISRDIFEGKNFVITQSALEHFKDYLIYFRKIKDYISYSKKNVIQIHLIPTKESFKIFLYHGLRQFTLRRISKITKLFNTKSYSILYKLGGELCYRLHYIFITKPLKKKGEDLRESRLDKYEKLLPLAMKKDMMSSLKYPSFYALIIYSNYLVVVVVGHVNLWINTLFTLFYN